jgi:hypothetical protein
LLTRVHMQSLICFFMAVAAASVLSEGWAVDMWTLGVVVAGNVVVTVNLRAAFQVRGGVCASVCECVCVCVCVSVRHCITASPCHSAPVSLCSLPLSAVPRLFPHAAMQIHTWNVFAHIAIWGSVSVFFFYCLIYQSILPEMNQTFGAWQVLFNEGERLSPRLVDTSVLTCSHRTGWYWFLLIVTVIIALLPFLVASYVRAFFFPDRAQLVREHLAQKRYQRGWSSSRNLPAPLQRAAAALSRKWTNRARPSPDVPMQTLSSAER